MKKEQKSFKALKLVSLMLCFVFVFAALAACSNKGQDDSSASGSSPSVSNSEVSEDKPVNDPYKDETTGRYWPDKLTQETIRDCIGDRKEVRVMVYNNTVQQTYFSEEIEPNMYETTDAAISNAVAERNNIIEDKLGIKVKAVPVDDVYAEFMKASTGGLDTFDIAMPFLGHCAQLAVSGNLYDLRKFEKEGIMDLNAPWYEKNANDTFSVRNRTFFVVSDMSIMHKIVSGAMVYNTEMFHDAYPDDDLYKLVIDHKWTLDKMYEYGKGVVADNGDNVWDYNDTWGISTSYGAVCGFYIGTGEKYCGKNEDDEPIIVMNNPRAIQVSQKILEIFQKPDFAIHKQQMDAQGATNGWQKTVEVFGEGRALFYSTAFSAIKKLRPFGVKFDLLPLPLADESQEKYTCSGGSYYSYGCVIPSYFDESKARFAALMIELMSATGKDTVAKAYYEHVLKLMDSLADPARDVDMLDLIFNNLSYDVGNVYDFKGINSVHETLMSRNSTDITSSLDALIPAAEDAIADLVEQYNKMP